jgi:regulator of sigma E protease
MNGVKVEEFGLGFPPRMFGVKKGETIYSINWLLLGGFVKVFGEEYYEQGGKMSAADKARAFVYKKPWQKAMIIIAGVVMNVLLGSAIFYFLLANHNFQSEPLLIFKQTNFRFGTTEGRVVVTRLIPGSPAEKAGLHKEDIVERYAIQPQTQWTQVTSAQQLINTIKSHPTSKVNLELENVQNGQKKTITVTPKYDAKQKRPIIGAELLDAAIISYKTPVEKIFSGFLHAYNMSVYNIKTIGFLINSSIQTRSAEPVSQSLSGPVGILGYVKDIVSTSGNKLLTNLLNITALFSLSLATINILPLPALDGGRLVFILYEWITGKRPNAKFERYYNATGFAALLLLMLLITINDISKLFLNH